MDLFGNRRSLPERRPLPLRSEANRSKPIGSSVPYQIFPPCSLPLDDAEKLSLVGGERREPGDITSTGGGRKDKKESRYFRRPNEQLGGRDHPCRPVLKAASHDALKSAAKGAASGGDDGRASDG